MNKFKLETLKQKVITYPVIFVVLLWINLNSKRLWKRIVIWYQQKKLRKLK